MGKETHLNPILSIPQNRYREPQTRKVRSDKLHDIKIPVNETIDTILRREARRNWNGSKTSLGTEILMFGLQQVFVYPDVTYKDSPFIVHCKVDHEVYQKLGDLATEWKCSVRKAAHRVFMEAIKKKQLGGITDGEI
ncbi:hypothetical protein [Neobacillus drentensis]|uniref:hypothetical protein n=1 Tax=Neobacillus drentensis TaxID=220684 RepID=UPI002FFDC349